MIRVKAANAALLLVFILSQAGAMAAATTSDGHTVEIGGAKIWYEECGAGADRVAVVLLHDGLVHSVTWDGVWEAVCAKYHVVRYDRRGYGRSEAAKVAFHPEDDLLGVMRVAHMERAVIVGNSSGGGLAIDFALAHPESVTALFLVGPVVHGMASSDYFNERGSKNNEPLAHGDAKGAAKNWSNDRFLIAGDDAGARKKLFDALANNPQNLNVAGGLEIRPSPPPVTRLAEIKAPTLVLVGDADIGDVFAYAGAIEAAVPLATLEIWKDTGHLIQIQRPAELVARLNRFVALATRKEVKLAAGTLAEYAGRYTLGGRAATVSMKDGRLVLEIPGDPYYWLFAASEAKFFMRTDDAEIVFEKDAGGKIAGMAIHNSDGSVIRAARVD